MNDIFDCVKFSFFLFLCCYVIYLFLTRPRITVIIFIAVIIFKYFDSNGFIVVKYNHNGNFTIEDEGNVVSGLYSLQSIYNINSNFKIKTIHSNDSFVVKLIIPREKLAIIENSLIFKDFGMLDDFLKENNINQSKAQDFLKAKISLIKPISRMDGRSSYYTKGFTKFIMS